MREPFADIRILTGPTGSGKTPLGLELAERLGVEIVSMDSMALYRGMDIGTAKPSVADRQRVRHHLVDVLDPWESASVAWWLERAAECCREIEGRGKGVLFVGGTPLYLKALLRGLFEGPARDAALRDRLEGEARSIGTPALHARLAEIDPAAARRIHRSDLRRIVRALEVWEVSGQPISSWQRQWSEGPEARDQEARVRNQGPGVRDQGSPAPRTLMPEAWLLTPVSCVWLDVPRAELYGRINRRVEEMFAAGLIDEVRALRTLPRPLSREAGQALGYKEVRAHLEGRATLAETMERVQTRTRQFAKRQISWFRHLPECRPLSPELTETLWQTTMDKQAYHAERDVSNSGRGR